MTHSAFIDEARRKTGLLTIAELEQLASQGNIIFDPFSVLISRYARIGSGNTFYPCVTLLCTEGSSLTIGDENTFHTNTLMEATSGTIAIGAANQFGEGGFTAKANRPGAHITIEDSGRYLNGCSVFGNSSLGSGSQVLGSITVDSCTLEKGGSYRDSDPDQRAGLLKGFGGAKGLSVPRGAVINGRGSFSQEATERQTAYHPKA